MKSLQCYVFACRILDNLRSQIEKRKQNNFLQIYTNNFPFQHWDPCCIKPCERVSVNETSVHTHPLPVMDEDGLKIRHYMINKRDDGGFYRTAECAYACYGHEECTCPDDCVFVTVLKTLPQTDNEPLGQIDFQPSERLDHLLSCDLQPSLNIQYVNCVIAMKPSHS